MRAGPRFGPPRIGGVRPPVADWTDIVCVLGPEFEQTFRRAQEWVDGANLVGLRIDDLIALAAMQNLVVRALPETSDDSAAITADKRADRINVQTLDDTVSRVDGVF